MAYPHLVEVLIEADKKLVEICNAIEKADQSTFQKKSYVDEINNIIRQLDHVVEYLEKKI